MIELRECTTCQKIKELNKTNFEYNKNAWKKNLNFRKQCRECSISNLIINLLADENTKLKIINQYEKSKNLTMIAQEYCCSPYVISKILKNNNINLKTYSFNEYYFDTLTAESAYWLGFIAADGGIYKNQLRIKIKSTDKKHLEKFKNSINGTQIIREEITHLTKFNKNEYKSNYIKICSKYIVKQLEKYNIIPNKSLIFEIPEMILNSKYLRDWCRGYFDGDGGITIRKVKNRTPYAQISIAGSKKTLEIFAQQFHKIFDSKLDKIFQLQGKIYELSYAGNPICSKILTWLYKDAKMYLDRKYKLSIKHGLINFS